MNRQFRNFLLDLVLDNRHYDNLSEQYCLYVDELSSHEKQQFLLLLLQRSEGDWINYLSDDIGSISHALVGLIKNPDIDNKCHFADTVLQNLLDSYKDKMQGLIDNFLNYEMAS